ncbi:MAG: molecular chaperone HtpG [Anaerovoracaceae bacterium]
MAKKQFKAESKKLLDLMINSIYTHKEIFLRELISNASDALDKLYYQSLESEETGIKRSSFTINLSIDKEARTITLSDNGIGMSREDLESNLGTIARSGSLDFKLEQEKKKDVDIIGQFGVGFYSAFMVSDDVTVITKAFGSDNAYKWESKGADGYTIEECEKETSGTEIILSIKEDTEEEKYETYLEDYTLKNLIKKYSDYIRYPIKLGDEVLNSMEPIWKKQKSKVKPEEYNDYYKSKFGDYTDPAKVIRTSVEGVSSYTALLFIPGHPPYDYYSKNYEKGLQLYSSGVMIMDKCEDLLPDYFNFVKGLVDSQDLSLNISRELLQHDRQLKNIAKNIEKKIQKELLDLLKNNREEYEKFYKNFGNQLKYGIYDNYGLHKETLQDLVLFYSSLEKKEITFDEYVAKMSTDQNYIYYASGESIEKIDMLPQTELIKEKGYEILYLTDDLDEFVLQVMRDYNGKEFKSVSAEDMDIEETQEEQEEMKKQQEDNKELLDSIKELLGDKVTEVKLSPRLKNTAVCLTAKDGLSLEMEKVLNSMPANDGIKAERILEFNPQHKIMEVLRAANTDDKELLNTYVNLLYNQALLISGLPVDNPLEFSNDICDLIIK